MLMIDGQIEAPMRIDSVEFRIFGQNCVKPLNVQFLQFDVFLMQLLEGFCSPKC